MAGSLAYRKTNRRTATRQRSRRRKRTTAQISFNMSQVRSCGSEIEKILEEALRKAKLKPKKQAAMIGRPDFVFPALRVAVFCDSHFWHGYKWKEKRNEIKSNRAFWLQKIEENIKRDRLVNRRLRKLGWTVIRFWQHQILRSPNACAAKVQNAIKARKGRLI